MQTNVAQHLAQPLHFHTRGPACIKADEIIVTVITLYRWWNYRQQVEQSWGLESFAVALHFIETGSLTEHRACQFWQVHLVCLPQGLCLCAELRMTGTHVPAAFCVSAKIRTRPSATSTLSTEPSSYLKSCVTSCKFPPFILLSLIYFPSIYHPSTHSCPWSFCKFALLPCPIFLMYVLHSHVNLGSRRRDNR